MVPITSFAGKRVAVFGLGGSGLATAEALLVGGARVVAWDDGEVGRANASARGVPILDLRTADWSGLSALVLSPGVPLTHPAPHWTVPLAKAAGVEIIGDIELFCRERAKRPVAPGAAETTGAAGPLAPLVAITGTNGKSTTTALVAHILRRAGWDVQMGGNIGTAVLSLEPPAPNRVYVIECSSYQIDLAPSLAPTVGVLLNITPDHLDRHGTMENYAAIKARLVETAETAVVGVDDEYGLAVYGRLYDMKRRVRAISVASRVAGGIFYHPPHLVRQVQLDASGSIAAEHLLDLTGIGSLRGAHNAQNAAAAFVACSALGVPHDKIADGMRSFPGLPHRMEQVGRIGPVLFVNDSKATNADAAEKALTSFDTIYWILGGKPKDGGIVPLAPHFPRIAQAYLIGAATEEFAATLDGKVPYARCGTLERAIAAAAEDAARSEAEEPVVLLSPACASFDQFPNFEVRGDRFRDLVLALPGLAPFPRS
ncbi:UDP-N-acetylmuramoyl-L-alanine--D-glutamate ligase [Chelatococcus sp. SYSU_G07232]|uniref:UDP-N-acetylmuramoylalanine--D-glutamate ligase n=1 Tax=Chelatococcus albus TaxID=3047466 RepID=A0ABT7AGW6_9HYPH|nr:UDP-N-acetylmuramoyl-L-alanine--D-glutamate ligase [Chelatococcus sp. SYSU_G07232]MDJ1158613.1 UDP-N-acetylmuramoyl-L-alanine--D-glutamate ligase [Chelatococcus sp. SYSU_G07232]